MIESITLKNFLSHEETSISLEDGINVFVGANGAGKSSVIDAVTYALYGEHTRDSDRNLVRRGSTWGAVMMTFTYGQAKYTVERKLGADGRLEGVTLRQLVPQQRLLAVGERRQYGESVSGIIANIMRLDYDKMRVAAIIQQGELDSIIQYRPAQFKSLMDSLIGIDRFGRAYEAMREPLDEFRERLRRECMGKYDDQNYQQLLDDIERVNSDIIENRKSQDAAKVQLDGVKGELDGVKLKLSELEPLRLKRDELVRLREQLKSYLSKLELDLRKRMSELERDIPIAERMLADAEPLPALQGELDKIKAEIESVTGELSSLESRISVARKSGSEIKRIDAELGREREELERVNKSIEQLEDKIKDLGPLQNLEFPENLEEMIEELEKRRDDLKDRRSSIKEKIKNYNEIKENGVCPTCDSDAKTVNVEFKLADANSQLESVIAELSEVEKSLKDKKETLKQMNEFNRKKDTISNIENTINAFKQQANRIKENMDSMVKHRAELERDTLGIDELKSELQARTERLNELKKLESEVRGRQTRAMQASSWLEAKGISSKESIDYLKMELNEIGQKIERLNEGSAVDEYSEVLAASIRKLEEETVHYDEAEYESLKSQEGELGERVSKIAGSLEAMRLKGNELEGERNDLEAVKVTVEKAMKYINLFGRIRNEIFNSEGSLATSLRSWAIRELSFYASEYVRSFGIGISEIRLSEKRREVSIECYSGNGLMDIKSLSGGESVAIALALRFAMAKLMGMGMIDFIILDEPTVYLDEERKSSLVNIISGFNAGGSIRQMIIITHDREIFENSSVDAMFQFEKQNGITRVSKS